MTEIEQTKSWPVGRVGFIAIIGRPNVGKSTFFNRVLNVHLAAVSARPQTTRRHWRGIYSDDEGQFIFVDTPGIHRGSSRLDQSMSKSVNRSLEDADAVVLMSDPCREPGDEDTEVCHLLRDCRLPLVLALNKSDISTETQRTAGRAFYLDALERDHELPVFNLSALTGENVDVLFNWLRRQLPEGPYFYPPDQVTDSFERDIAQELIREAALEHLHQEVPHALAVEIELWKAGPKRIRIDAVLYVERDGQRPIVIGRKGQMLERIRRGAIPNLRELVDAPVDLRLHVKVAEDWRNRAGMLQDLGF